MRFPGPEIHRVASGTGLHEDVMAVVFYAEWARERIEDTEEQLGDLA